jgi:hypothetical protein
MRARTSVLRNVPVFINKLQQLLQPTKTPFRLAERGFLEIKPGKKILTMLDLSVMQVKQ